MNEFNNSPLRGWNMVKEYLTLKDKEMNKEENSFKVGDEVVTENGERGTILNTPITHEKLYSVRIGNIAQSWFEEGLILYKNLNKQFYSLTTSDNTIIGGKFHLY